MFAINFPASASKGIKELIIVTDFKSYLNLVTEDKEKIEELTENDKEEKSASGTAMYVINRLMADDRVNLDAIESEISALDDKLLCQKNLRQPVGDFVRIRKSIQRLKKHYEVIAEFYDYIVQNDFMFCGADYSESRAMESRYKRLLSETVSIREYLSQVRETYLTQVDISQNKLMKTFTVITVILAPLQLITGWYGMNLIMPETKVAIFYPILAIICISIVAVCIWIFRKRKWF